MALVLASGGAFQGPGVKMLWVHFLFCVVTSIVFFLVAMNRQGVFTCVFIPHKCFRSVPTLALLSFLRVVCDIVPPVVRDVGE